MQVTTDGKPKMIDIVDCTGGGKLSYASGKTTQWLIKRLGDVETSKVVKPTTEDGRKVIEGLSGRKLILGDWTNPSDEYRIGLKRAYELFPNDLCSRIKAVSGSDDDSAARYSG